MINMSQFQCVVPPNTNDEDGKVVFWINTGRSTCIDGYKTKKEINDFIKRIKKEGVQFFIDSDKCKF